MYKLINGAMCPVSGLPIIIRDGWGDIVLTKSYSVSFALIGNQILFITPCGNSGKNGMELLLKKREEIIISEHLREKKFVEIKNYQNLKGSTSREGRQLFLEMLERERRAKEMLGFFCFNSSLFVRMSYNVARKFAIFSYPIVICKDYADSIKKAVKVIDSRVDTPVDSHIFTAEEINPKLKNMGKNFDIDEMLKYNREIMNFIGTINWNRSTKPLDIESISEYHPFKPIFDAIYFIKQDFDDIIDENKKSLQKQEESTQRFKAVFDQSHNPVAMIEIETGKFWTNLSWSDLFKNQEDMISFPFEAMDELQVDNFKKKWNDIKQGKGELKQSNFRIMSSSLGIRDIELSIKKFTNSFSSFILISARDITEKLIAKQEKIRYEEKLYQSDKLNAIGELASGISHDYNNQLAGIAGYAAILSRKIELGAYEEAEKYAAKIEKAVSQAAELTSGLLTFARKENSQLVDVNVKNILDEVVTMLDHSVGESIIVVLDECESTPVVLANTATLSNAFLNIGINARDAIGKDGKIHFRCENVNIQNEIQTKCGVQISAGQYVCVSVSDTGSGIDNDVIDHIFEPFYTTKEKGKGTGMGLSAVFGTISKLNGAIDIETEKGKGSTFKIYIPVACSDIEDFSERSNDELSVLIIDDDEAILDITADYFSDVGINCITINNGAEGIAYFKENYQNIDVVLLDLVLPVMSGYEIFEKLKVIDPNLIVIIISGFGFSGRIEKLLADGAKMFIEKPMRYKCLVKDIKKLVLDNKNMAVN